MEQKAGNIRFQHELKQLQHERQAKEMPYEVYKDRINALIEEEIHGEQVFSQGTRRAQLWQEAENNWQQMEQEKKAQDQTHIDRMEQDRKAKLVAEQKVHEREQTKMDLITKAEEEKLKPYMAYIKRVIDTDLQKMHRDANNYRRWYNIFQCIVIIGSIVATTLVNIEGLPRWITAIFSAIVGIVSGFIVAFKFKDRSFNLQKTVDLIEHEYHLFELKIEEYNVADAETRHQKFATKLTYLQNEQRQREQLLEQSSDSSTHTPITK